MWRGFKEFFTYNRKQRNGLIFLAVIALLIQLFLHFDTFFYQTPNIDFEDFERAIAQNRSIDSLVDKEGASILFEFDPNTASSGELEDLGLGKKQIQTLSNFRNKGGSFKKVDDLMKIYGMDLVWFEKVKPYIIIQNQETEFVEIGRSLELMPFKINEVSSDELVNMRLEEWQARRIISFREKVRPYRSAEDLFQVYDLDSVLVNQLLPFVIFDTIEVVLKTVEINSADSIALLSLPGVGPTFASRILKYRKRLGGFYRTDQILEVYGMDEQRLASFVDLITLDQSQIYKLDLNGASFKELLSHPYLEYEVVKNMVNFREHGRYYEKIDELKQIELIDDRLFSKIANYLSIGPQSSKAVEKMN